MSKVNVVRDLDFISRANADYVDDLYRQYLNDPASVDEHWALFFAGFEAARGNGAAGAAASTTEPAPERIVGVFDLIHSYRELGHLIANLDPLGHNQSSHPLLELSEFGFTDGDLDRVMETPSFKARKRATLRELVAYASAQAGYRRRIVGLPEGLGKAQAWVFEHLPGKLLTRDNLLSMRVDSVCNCPFPAVFGGPPRAMEDTVPGYLSPTGETDSFSVYRRRRR